MSGVPLLIRKRRDLDSPDVLVAAVKDEVLRLLDDPVAVEREGRPLVILVAGVNGVGTRACRRGNGVVVHVRAARLEVTRPLLGQHGPAAQHLAPARLAAAGACPCAWLQGVVRDHSGCCMRASGPGVH